MHTCHPYSKKGWRQEDGWVLLASSIKEKMGIPVSRRDPASKEQMEGAEGDTHILLCGFTDAHKHAALTHVDIHTEIKR